jgi:hypothetical protein
MQYWVKHRFEDGAISSLIGRLREKNTNVLRMWYTVNGDEWIYDFLLLLINKLLKILFFAYI